MNKPIKNIETETVINNLPKSKSPGPDGFTEEFCQTLREELMPIFLKRFPKIAEEGTFPNLFYKAKITLIPKSGKDNMKKRQFQANNTDEHRFKNPQQNSSKQNPTTHQKPHTPLSSWVYSRDTRLLQYTQMNHCDTLY